MKKIYHHLSIVGWQSFNLNLFRHIIHRQKNILIIAWWDKWPYEVDSPNIENINFKKNIERHLISLGHISNPLAAITSQHELMNIFKQRRPEKSHLKNTGSCLLSTIMATIDSRITVLQNILRLTIRNASPYNLICSISEQEWLIPSIPLHLM